MSQLASRAIPELEKAQARYDHLAGTVAGASVDDPRRFLLIATGDEVEKIRARIKELGGSA